MIIDAGCGRELEVERFAIERVTEFVMDALYGVGVSCGELNELLASQQSLADVLDTGGKFAQNRGDCTGGEAQAGNASALENALLVGVELLDLEVEELAQGVWS